MFSIKLTLRNIIILALLSSPLLMADNSAPSQKRATITESLNTQVDRYCKKAKMDAHYEQIGAKAERHVVVMIDQTTDWRGGLEEYNLIESSTEKLINDAKAKSEPVHLTVVSFSALGGRTDHVRGATSTVFDATITPNTLSAKEKIFNTPAENQAKQTCFAYFNKINYIKYKKAIAATLEDVGGSHYTTSDIIGALYDVAAKILTSSGASKRTLVLYSDLLQNTKELSFYRSKKFDLKIDVQAAMNKIDGLNFQLSNCDIWVYGALLGPSKNQLVPISARNKLELFWRTLIGDRSGGTVREIGFPHLIQGSVQI